MPSILFVCIENANRSQMAEAFVKRHGAGLVQAYSAGSNPSGQVNDKAITAMQEIGYDLSKHTSTSVDDLPGVRFDYLVSMGCGDACPAVPACERIEWDIPDPKHMDAENFRQVRDLIERKVKALLKDIATKEAKT